MRLGVNVDHVATLRQQRGTRYPDPATAAALAELAGAHQITIHLREDRRHIQDRDLHVLRQTVQTRLNLEMADTAEMRSLASIVQPDSVTLVPEKRAERTTEGGLDVVAQEASLREHVAALRAAGPVVSLFIDPDEAQVAASARVGAQVVELHTGDYANDASPGGRARELARLAQAASAAHAAGLEVAAGHGLDYTNVAAVVALPHVVELNIGHSIMARAILVGLDRAVREMLALMGV